MATFGDVLRRDRERKELSQDALAKLLGVSQQAVANWESGASLPAKHRREKLYEVLGRDSLIAQFRPPYEFLPVQDHPADQEPKTSRPEADRPPPTPPEGRPVPHPGGWAVRGMRDRQQRRMDILAELKAALPEHLRAGVGKKRNFGQVERDYEYVSNGVVARIVEIPPGPYPLVSYLAVPLIRLAMAVDPPMAEPSVNCVLFVLTAENPAVVRRRMEGFILDAGILSVTVEIVANTQEIAQAITGLEALYATEKEKFDAWLKAVADDATEHEEGEHPDLTWEEIEALPKIPPVSKQKPPDEDLF